jgi:outer membrane protein TolC
LRNETFQDNKGSRKTATHLFWLVAVVLLWSGCSSGHYRRSADKEVYATIQQVEDKIFGRTNAFNIDTPYSARTPEEILPAELIEESLQTGRRLLTIEDALLLSIHNSRRYQAEKERLYLTALTLTGERYAFSPQFFARSSANFDRTSRGDEIASVNTRVGVSQMLQSGGVLGVTLANDLLRYYTGDPRRSAVSTISVNLVQPLLRGFGRNNPAVENLTQAERNVVYAVRNFSFFQDQFAIEIVNDYFALLEQKDVIRNRYTNYLGRIRSTERLEARKDRERAADIGQALQAELTAKNNYINAVASYRNALDQFKIKLALPLGESLSLDDQVIEEVRLAGLVPVQADAEEAFRLAVEQQLLMLNSIDRFEDSKRKIRVAADRLRPGLNLFADASLASDPPTDFTKFDADNIRAGVGIELDLPIDRLRERNTYRATLVSFESELRNLTLALDSLKDSIQRGLRTVEQRRQNYQIQTNALRVANLRVESAEMNLEAGRAEVRDLVEAQDAQIAAQNAVTSALVDYQRARLQLMLDIGALETESPRFWLRDHLTVFLARETVPIVPDLAEQPVLSPEQIFNN